MKPAIYATLMTLVAVIAVAATTAVIRLAPPIWIWNALMLGGSTLALIMIWRLFYVVGKERS